ncbi:MAG: hypothetical protein HRT66_04765, partial [Flavobacteriaceae bacterium]|nr:hypothetical protein [Flavobacteriaceae bacterium]
KYVEFKTEVGINIYSNVVNEHVPRINNNNTFKTAPGRYYSKEGEPVMFRWYYDGVSLFIEIAPLPGQRYERIDEEMEKFGF